MEAPLSQYNPTVILEVSIVSRDQKCEYSYILLENQDVLTWTDAETAAALKRSMKYVFLKMSKKLKEKHLCRSLFINKIAGLMTATLLKKTSTQVFSVNFAKFLRIPFFIEQFGHLQMKLFFYVCVCISYFIFTLSMKYYWKSQILVVKDQKSWLIYHVLLYFLYYVFTSECQASKLAGNTHFFWYKLHIV